MYLFHGIISNRQLKLLQPYLQSVITVNINISHISQSQGKTKEPIVRSKPFKEDNLDKLRIVSEKIRKNLPFNKPFMEKNNKVGLKYCNILKFQIKKLFQNIFLFTFSCDPRYISIGVP